MIKYFLFLLIMIIVSCGEPSDNGVSNSTATYYEKIDNLNFDAYAELVANNPCSNKLHGVVAHISQNNTDYVCFYDEKTGVWNWNALQSEILELQSSSSSISNTVLIISSSSQMSQNVSFSSSEGIKSISELAGTSCVIDLYRDSDEIMSYMAQGLVLPIEGSSNLLKCLKNGNGEWVWTIVENESLNKSSSSNGFKFGTFTDSRDGQVYKTIGIKYGTGIDSERDGTEEIWFAEDLRYCPKCEQSSAKTMLYNWQEAMQSSCMVGKSCTWLFDVQGICPDGWLVLPMTDVVIRIGNEVVGQKLVDIGADYWNIAIETEHVTERHPCYETCTVLDCVPYYDPEIFTKMFYTEVDNLGLAFVWNGVYAGDCSTTSISKFQNTKHRLRCYKKGRVSSAQTTVDLCWSKYDGLTTKNICDEEKRLGL